MTVVAALFLGLIVVYSLWDNGMKQKDDEIKEHRRVKRNLILIDDCEENIKPGWSSNEK